MKLKIRRTIFWITNILLISVLAFFIIGPFVANCNEEEKPEPQLDLETRIQRAVSEYGAYVFDEPTSTKTEQEHLEALSLRAEEICTEKYFLREYDSYYIKVFHNIVSEKPQFFQIEYDGKYLLTGIIENDEYYELLWEDYASSVKTKDIKDEKLYIIPEHSFITIKENLYQNPFIIVYKQYDNLYYLSGRRVDASLAENYYEYSEKFVIDRGVLFTGQNIISNYIKSVNDLEIHKRLREEAYYRFFIPEYNSIYSEQEHIERINEIAEQKLLDLQDSETSYISCDTKILYSHDEKPRYFMVSYRTDGSSLGGEKIPEKYDLGIIIDDAYYLIMQTDEKDKTMQFKEEPDKIYYSAVHVFAKKKGNVFEEISVANKGLESITIYCWSFKQNYFAVENKPNPTVTDAFNVYGDWSN